ncbi:MAG: DUF2971 domain-containing protein [Chthoniobacterales bacterium]
MAVEVLEHAGALPDHLPLWRYMKLSSLLLLLTEGTSFFPSVATLRSADPLEGGLNFDPAWLGSELSKRFGQTSSNDLDAWLLAQVDGPARTMHAAFRSDPISNTAFFADLYQKELARRRAVWCWFASEIESAAMWSIYGHGGVAVGTTVGALRKGLPNTQPFLVSRIRYVDRRPSSLDQFDPEDSNNSEYVHRPFFIKGREFGHEHEVRFVTFCDEHEKGTKVRGIASDNLIREIVISPLLVHQEARAVETVLKKHAWKPMPEIRRSTLLGFQPDYDETKDVMENYMSELKGEWPEDTPAVMRVL